MKTGRERPALFVDLFPLTVRNSRSLPAKVLMPAFIRYNIFLFNKFLILQASAMRTFAKRPKDRKVKNFVPNQGIYMGFLMAIMGTTV